MIKLIYDTKDFIDLHDHDKIIYFETNINNKKISLNIPVNNDDIVDLPVKGSYSFFNFEKRFSLTEIDIIINEFENFLQKNSVQEIRITFPPDNLNNSIKPFFYIMSVRGWIPGDHDLSSIINLNEDYRKKFSKSAKNRLNKSLKVEGLNFKKADNLDDWKKAYDCILKNRQEKGYYLAMSFDQILEMQKFNIKAFVLQSVSVTYSACLVYFHSNNLAQVIYWGSIKEGEELSLQYRLVYELFNILNLMGISKLDLGASTKSTSFNSGLFDYKTQLGAITSINYKLKFNLNEINN